MNVLATVAGYPVDQFHDLPLSARMRESWETKRFWFNYATKRSFDVDVVYGATLRSLLDPATREKLAPLVQEKMEQLNAYVQGRICYSLSKLCP
jgi:hypothetical protein